MPATTHALTDGQALPVSSFSFINIRFNAEASPVKVQGSLSDSEFSTIHDRITVGGPVYEDSDGFTSFNEGRIITLDVRAIEEIRFVGDAVNINVSPFDQALIVAAATEGDVRAAIEQAHAAGGGSVHVMRGTIILTEPLPLLDGVEVVGTTLGNLTFTTIPDSNWAFDEGNMTLFKGDGTFPAFAHNHIDSGTAPTVQADFANEMVTNASLRRLAFDNFTAAWHVGAVNKAGCFGGYYGECFIKNTTDAAYIMLNSMHFHLSRNQIIRSFLGAAGRIGCNVAESILQTGNFFVDHQFAAPSGDGSGVSAKQRRQARGFEFVAGVAGGVTSYLNEVHARGFQCNHFARTPLTVTATFTSGSANIGVPDGTEFIVGMPVRFTSTPASGFATNRVYIVRSVSGNVITLALDRSTTVITAGSSTTASMLTNGMAALEVRADNATSRVTNSEFHALDLEGTFGAGLYVDRAGACDFQISQFGSEANNVDIVMRGSINCGVLSLNTAVTDIDGTSSAVRFFGRQTMLDRPGKGFSFETGLNAHIMSMGGSGITAVRMTSGDGFRMAANAGFGLQYISRTASLTMGNQNFGTIVLSGTTSGQNITLPVASASTGETGNAGALVFIVNRSNQNWTIQTQSSQTFNGVAGKTSFTLPAGQSVLITSGGTGYGAILGAALP